MRKCRLTFESYKGWLCLFCWWQAGQKARNDRNLKKNKKNLLSATVLKLLTVLDVRSPRGKKRRRHSFRPSAKQTILHSITDVHSFFLSPPKPQIQPRNRSHKEQENHSYPVNTETEQKRYGKRDQLPKPDDQKND